MLSHDEYVRLQLAEVCVPAAALPPVIEWPVRGDMAGVVLRVIDGDSFDVAALVRLGTLRINGIDAPEMDTAAGKSSKRFAVSLVPVGRVLCVRVDKPDKFGHRWDGDLQMPDGEWFSDESLRAGYSKPYDGGKRG